MKILCAAAVVGMLVAATHAPSAAAEQPLTTRCAWLMTATR